MHATLTDGAGRFAAGANAHVEKRPVQIGFTANGQTQIRGGVQKGDMVILGNEPLEAGEKVKVVTA